MIISFIQGVSKKCNLFDLEYLKGSLVKLIDLLVCYSVLPYNSIKPNLGSYDNYNPRYDV